MVLTADVPTVVTVAQLVSSAVRAPSVHNTQPWAWRYADGVVSLLADFSRQIRGQDPDARDLIISCGAALHHFRIAARHHGWSTSVRRMPDRDRPELLAEIRLRHSRRHPSDSTVYEAIAARRSDRRHYAGDPVPLSYLDYLTESATRQGALGVAIEDARAQETLNEMLRYARLVHDADREGTRESDSWMADRPYDGVPSANRIRIPDALDTQLRPVTRFSSGTLADDQAGAGRRCGHWMAIGTSSDDSLSRVRAGEALSAVLLQSVADGMNALPLSQAIEVDATRHQLEESLFGGAVCLQMLVQVRRALPELEEVPATPRRPLREVFDAEMSELSIPPSP